MKRTLRLLLTVIVMIAIGTTSTIGSRATENIDEINLSFNPLEKAARIDVREFVTNEGIGFADEVSMQVFANLVDDCDSLRVVSETVNEKIIEGFNCSKAYVLNGTTYQDVDSRIIVLQALATTVDNTSGSTSGQNYGIAASCTIYMTRRYNVDPSLGYDMKLNSVSAIYTRLSTATTNVNKISYCGEIVGMPLPGTVVHGGNTVQAPVSGTTYSTSINSSTYYPHGQYLAYVALEVYYANGQVSNYTKYI